MWLLRFLQKCVSDQEKELHFCHPIFTSNSKTYNLIGCAVKFFRLRRKPLFSVNPLRNKFQSNELPICVKVELINKSCFSNASAKLQLGVLSSSSEIFKSSPNSSVIKGRFSTVSYLSELGFLIFPIVER